MSNKFEYEDRLILKFDEPFNLVDNYTIIQMEYDTDHGKSEYSDENNRMDFYELEDETIKGLRQRLDDKMRTLYY